MSDRAFEKEIRHGTEFMTTTDSRFVILNHPEDPDIKNVVYEDVYTETVYTEPRETIETFLRSGHWREAVSIDSESNR